MATDAAERYRHSLRQAVGASAGPYGYTLTVWTSGAVLVHNEGLPTGVEAVLFAVGSTVAFATAGAIAFSFRPAHAEVATRVAHPALWGSLHFVPIALAIAAATVIGSLFDGPATWPIGGLVVTGIYLASVGGQIMLAHSAGSAPE